MAFEAHLNPHLVNPSIAQYQQQMVDGIQARTLALKRVAKMASLRVSGIAKPATMLNFNPVPLRVEGGITFKVPSTVDPAVFPDDRIEYEYRGHKYLATVCTVRDPILYTWIKDVAKDPDQELSQGRGVYDIEVCKQIEVVHSFWEAYTEGCGSSSGMGGVLIFEGDKHALKSATINVPKYIDLQTGILTKVREFFTEPRDFNEVLAETLDRQRTYYENQLQIAQVYYDDPDQRKNVTMVHRVWAQWGLDMGFREKSPEWLLSTEENVESCGGCGAAKKRALAYFCHACNRAYDPFQAYMDKEILADSVHMLRIRDEQWPLVHAEEKRRKALRTPPEEDAAAKGKGK